MSEILRKQFEEETGLIAQIDGSYNRTYTQWLEDELKQRLESGQHETIVIDPTLVKGLETKIRDCDDDLDEVGWGYQKGIIISKRDAIKILDALKEQGQ